ncbi:MAG: TonB-dependent receptor plug domain-containing protein [Weeksellaceae bacterium]|nr:TonB-dependent receptor plug domain-containing protein [Weeksellaceae bacterium]
MYKNLLFLVFICCHIIGVSQVLETREIHITLQDKASKPLAIIPVYISEIDEYATTEGNGSLAIEIPAELKTLNIEILGSEYANAIVNIALTQTQSHWVIKVDKTEGSVQLDQLTVRGMSHGEKMRERGFAVGVVETKAFENQSVQSVELLNRAAGIGIRQSGGLGSDLTFNLNGLTGNSVRIFIDGISIRNYGRSFSLNSIPPSMIERIEIYKGVLPTDLAEDALGGGVNIILKKNMRNSAGIAYSYGSFNTHQVDANAAFTFPESGIRLRLSGFRISSDNNYEVWGNNVYLVDNTTGRKTYIRARRFHDSFLAAGVKADVGITEKSWADELNLGFILSKTDKDVQTGATMQIVYGNRRTEYDTKMASLDYKKNNFLVKGLDVKSLTTFSRTDRIVIDTIPFMYNWLGEVIRYLHGNPVRWNRGGGEAGPATLASNLEDNIANRTNLLYRILPNHSISANYYINYFTREIDDPLMPNEMRDAMDKRKFMKQVAGLNYEALFFDQKLRSNIFFKHYIQNVRLTEVTRTFQPFTGSYLITTNRHDRKIHNNGVGMALSYRLSEKYNFVMSGEQAVRLPGSTELLGNTSENIDPNYNLRAEKSFNLNAGVIAGPYNLAQHSILFDVNFFTRDIKDMILQGVSRNSDDTYNFENLGKVLSKGFDLDIKYNYAQKLFVHSTISYNDTRFNRQYNDLGVEYFYYRSRVRNLPFFNANVNVDYAIKNVLQTNSLLSINYNLSYIHEFYRDWENLSSVNKATIPTQLINDLALVYHFPNRKIALAFNAKNIFNEQAFDNYALQKPGRAFFGKLTYNFL